MTRARTNILAALAFTAVAACAGEKKAALEPTAAVPAAEGQIRSKKTEQGNTKLDLEVKYLAPPNRVAPGAQVYIVWAQRYDKSTPPQNIGALTVDENRKGKLETLTPLDRFDVFVTPEPSPDVTEPTNDPVMRSHVEP